MTNYSIYYSYKEIGDVLIIVLDNEKAATKSIKSGRVTVIYNGDEIIGYNIFDVKNILKIKNQGMIYFPNPGLIDVINSILVNEGCEPLVAPENSGYFVGEVKEVNPLENNKNIVKVSLGKEDYSAIIKDQNLSSGDKVVIALAGTKLNNGSSVKENDVNGIKINAHVCTCAELGIKGEEILLLDKDVTVGEDFFTMEVK